VTPQRLSLLLIKIFPNAAIKNHAIITVIAAPFCCYWSFIFTEGCAVGALGSSSPLLTSDSEPPVAGGRAIANGSWD
jgi:hypothetical protein